jgi:acetone carboxylase gamma subunit
MSRYNPKNIMEAMTYQLEDDVKVLRGLSVMGDRDKFNKYVKVLQAHINCCVIPTKPDKEE